MPGDGKHGLACCDFQNACGTFAHIGFLVVVSHPREFLGLCLRQVKLAWLSHRGSLLKDCIFLRIPLPG